MRSFLILFIATLCAGCGSSVSSNTLTFIRPSPDVTSSTDDKADGTVPTQPQPDMKVVLNTHCGISGLSIEGVWWEASPEVNIGSGEIWSQAGVLHFDNDSRATFTGTSVTGAEIKIFFHRSSASPIQLGCI